MVLWLEYVIETIFGLGLFFKAMVFLPQLIKLYRSKSAQNISLLTFLGFNIMQIVTILYGYTNKDYILMTGFLLSFLICGSITTLIILYKKG